MESVRAYFSHRFGVEATGFTVVAGEFEAMSAIYSDLTGGDLSLVVRPGLRVGHAWVGGDLLWILYGYDHDASLRTGKGAIFHEYFHVLQRRLASRSYQGPYWLLEGLAMYAEYAAKTEYSDDIDILGARDILRVVQPYQRLAVRGVREPDLLQNLSAELARIEDPSSFYEKESLLDYTSYELSFIASVFLVEEQAKEEGSYVNYWKLLGERSTWQQAFEEAFGISLDGFYAAFEASALPFPRVVQLDIQLRLPEGQFTDFPGRVWLEFERQSWEGGRPDTYLGTLGHDSGTLEVYYTLYYTQGSVGTSYLSLWWSDGGPTMCLRGWYRDGSLTPRKEDATAVEFTGKSANIDWNLPAHPSTLPSLGCR